MRVRCRFLVPTHYNDGRPVEAEKIVLIKQALDRHFGGCRFCSPSEGIWQGQVEGMWEVECAVLKKRVPDLRQIVIEIGRDLDQKAMFFDAAPEPTVEIIDIESGEDSDDEEE